MGRIEWERHPRRRSPPYQRPSPFFTKSPPKSSPSIVTVMSHPPVFVELAGREHGHRAPAHLVAHPVGCAVAPLQLLGAVRPRAGFRCVGFGQSNARRKVFEQESRRCRPKGDEASTRSNGPAVSADPGSGTRSATPARRGSQRTGRHGPRSRLLGACRRIDGRRMVGERGAYIAEKAGGKRRERHDNSMLMRVLNPSTVPANASRPGATYRLPDEFPRGLSPFPQRYPNDW